MREQLSTARGDLGFETELELGATMLDRARIWPGIVARGQLVSGVTERFGLPGGTDGLVVADASMSVPWQERQNERAMRNSHRSQATKTLLSRQEYYAGKSRGSCPKPAATAARFDSRSAANDFHGSCGDKRVGVGWLNREISHAHHDA
jgi:hypothetical protein